MTEKKKVLYVITKGNWGGAQRYVYDLATNLPQDQFEPVVACGAGGLLIERLQEAGVRTLNIEELGRDIRLRDDFRVFKKLIKLIKEERPNIVHLNSSKIGGLGALAAFWVNLISKKHKLKIIFTGHGWAFNEERNFWQRTVILLLHWLTVILCHKTIAVSEKAKKDISHLPWTKNKIEVIHNGIAKFKPLPRTEAREFLKADDKNQMLILSLSELHRNKGLDVALKALSLLPTEARGKILYCIAGDGEEKDRLERLSHELKLQKSVRFLGFLPDGKKLLSGADIFLLPSRTEAFPYVILEAGFAGLPVVAACVGGIPEVVRDMQNGILIHPRNPREIAEAILYLLDHRDKQKEFGEEIKKTVANFFSLEKMLRETINLYN